MLHCRIACTSALLLAAGAAGASAARAGAQQSQLASTAFAWQLSGWPEGVGGNDAKKKKVGGRDPPPDTPCCWKKWKKDKGKGKGKGKGKSINGAWGMGHGAWTSRVLKMESVECGEGRLVGGTRGWGGRAPSRTQRLPKDGKMEKPSGGTWHGQAVENIDCRPHHPRISGCFRLRRAETGESGSQCGGSNGGGN